MTDRELLELAAKAAGIECEFVRLTSHEEIYGCYLTNDGPAWNPLLNDGDALRLAVKLELAIYSDNKNGGSWCCGYDEWVFPLVNHNSDPYAATRRAIVRAAAEIGKGLIPFPSAEEIEQFANMDDKPEWMK
jgi:hypothetical protein